MNAGSREGQRALPARARRPLSSRMQALGATTLGTIIVMLGSGCGDRAPSSLPAGKDHPSRRAPRADEAAPPKMFLTRWGPSEFTEVELLHMSNPYKNAEAAYEAEVPVGREEFREYFTVVGTDEVLVARIFEETEREIVEIFKTKGTKGLTWEDAIAAASAHVPGSAVKRAEVEARAQFMSGFEQFPGAKPGVSFHLRYLETCRRGFERLRLVLAEAQRRRLDVFARSPAALFGTGTDPAEAWFQDAGR